MTQFAASLANSLASEGKDFDHQPATISSVILMLLLLGLVSGSPFIY
jgi:hypothetical protein